MRRYGICGVMAALIFMSGCSENEVTSEKTAQAVSTAAVTEAAESTSFFVPVRDLDPEAIERGMDGIPYFTSSQLEEVSFYPSDEAVKRCGRFIEHNDFYYLSYTCSAVTFVFSGDRIEAVMTSNGNVYADNQQGWVGVVINGELKKRIRLDAGENVYTLYEGEELSNAEVSIVKLSENQMATTGIKSIDCHARKIAPKSEKPLKIEFIGDSITCGYGNEADGPSDGYDSAQQNGMATYGYYTAQALNAELSCVSISGIGLISDYTGTVGVKEDYLLMPDVYDYNDANFQLRRGFDELTRWEFGDGSDVVVINLGTNDYSYTGKNEDLQNEFGSAYYNFIGQVREKNPDAYIICTMGIMGSELYAEIEGAAESFAKDNGDERVLTFEFDYQSEEDGYGGDYHPSTATHKKAAEKLTVYIEELLG